MAKRRSLLDFLDKEKGISQAIIFLAAIALFVLLLWVLLTRYPPPAA